MTNATETPAAAAPVDEKKVEKEPEPETTAPEEPELENGKNGNGHAKEGNGDAEEGNGHAEDEAQDVTDAKDNGAVEDKEENPLKRKEVPLDAEDDCLKKPKVVDADEKETDSAGAVEA